MNHFQTIIVPTDFSPNAYDAVVYATVIAEKSNKKILLIHVYQGFYSGFQSETQNQKDLEAATIKVERKMEELIQQLQTTFDTINISGKCIAGELTGTIEAQAKENQSKLIVMGTKGASGIKSMILGSNTLDICKTSSFPIIVVPENNQHLSINHIGFFTDYQKEDKLAVHAIPVLIGSAQISLYHIQKKKDELDYHKFNDWLLALQSGTDLEVKGHLYQSDYPEKEAFRIIEQDHLDLLALTFKEDNFFENLLKKSFAKTLIHQPKIPVLILKSRNFL